MNWKCLCVKQPWADIIVAGHKDVENRAWRTEFRGDIVVCSSLEAHAPALRWATTMLLVEPEKLAYGHAIGVVTLADIVHYTTCESYWMHPTKWCWILKDARRFSQPVPVRGQLNLFQPDDPYTRQMIDMAIEEAKRARR